MTDGGRHVHLDAAGGIAGDMFVAALLDAFPEARERVFGDLAALMPGRVGRPALQDGLSGGLTVKRFGLLDAGGGARHHHSSSDDGTAHGTGYTDLCAMITAAALHPETARHALAILAILAQAEAAMHGVRPEQVHFHELADWDSLMDVVAAGSIIAALAGATWSVSALPLGGGLVRTSHGMLPVPAPATARMLTGFAWRDDGIPGERVTPTGAAILACLLGDKPPSAPAPGILDRIGTGAGTRDLAGMPNILRALVFQPSPRAGTGEDEVVVIAFVVDDMTGEEIAIAADRLRAAPGVLDMDLGGRMGKKGRPGTEFRLLAAPERWREAAAECFRQTSTIGLRWRRENRLCLRREADAHGQGGRILRGKTSHLPDGTRRHKVESDDLAAGAGDFDSLRRLKARHEQGG